jgi:isoaspartyl peptidase/L-asparaginase-like protein (Ntn-hydrolase superfamily)
MRGSDQAAGGVALVRHTRHPVAAAVAMLDQPEVLLAGERADAFAAAGGLEQRDPAEFVTERQRRRLASRLAGDGGTVGAVCLDADGLLAAATSTGGLSGQRPGRVGDSPVIGAGTWADRRVAVSCTGKGESFVRAGAARLLGALVASGVELETAGRSVLEAVGECDGDGGLIAVDARGEIVLLFSTEAMPRGVWRDGEDPVVEIP